MTDEFNYYMNQSLGDHPINPKNIQLQQGGTLEYFGLTKREYFAAMAMQAVGGAYFHATTEDPEINLARESIKLADELIKQLNESGADNGS